MWTAGANGAALRVARGKSPRGVEICPSRVPFALIVALKTYSDPDVVANVTSRPSTLPVTGRSVPSELMKVPVSFAPSCFNWTAISSEPCDAVALIVHRPATFATSAPAPPATSIHNAMSSAIFESPWRESMWADRGVALLLSHTVMHATHAASGARARIRMLDQFHLEAVARQQRSLDRAAREACTTTSRVEHVSRRDYTQPPVAVLV